MHNELERMAEGLKILSKRTPGGTKETHERS
jgi:hypothetical protein